MHLFGITWVGIDPDNGRKLLLSVAFVGVVTLTRMSLRRLVGFLSREGDHETVQTNFWTGQGISLVSAVLLFLGLLSIWFSNPAQLTSVLTLMSAGLAFALQQPVTSLASYFVILRGNTFTVGDRISMGGVRGDVLRLGFIQTTIMEMGQPPSVQGADPAMWVRSRQFTGRIVTVSNAKIFDDPVFNYTRDFPFFWEEMMLPITYKADRAKVEEILLSAARQHSVKADALAADAKEHLDHRYSVAPIDLEPRVFYRLTDNWLELTVRFLAPLHATRVMKDAMSRFIIAELDKAGIGIASATYDIVGFPPIAIGQEPAPAAAPDRTPSTAME